MALAYHQAKGLLGVGDLHPGKEEATEQLISWLDAESPQRVLEVGAGMGNTASRLARRGWAVTALEPDPVLFDLLDRRGQKEGFRAQRCFFKDYAPDHRVDAIIAESVLFMTDLKNTFEHARALLRPGGVLAFVEAVWVDEVSGEQALEIHEASLRTFGIPVASSEARTFAAWEKLLCDVGFDTVHAKRVAPSAPRSWRRQKSLQIFKGLSQNPAALLGVLRYAWKKRDFEIPPGSLESWLYLGRSANPDGVMK